MKENSQKKIIKFEDYRTKIIEALQARTKEGIIKIAEPVTLLEGFINEPFAKDLTKSLVIGGPTVPMIMLAGNESGQVYLFALRIILPEIEF